MFIRHSSPAMVGSTVDVTPFLEPEISDQGCTTADVSDKHIALFPLRNHTGRGLVWRSSCAMNNFFQSLHTKEDCNLS